ncbi:serine/threonine-protein phosphatase 6 regulatory ankyrin repeat subunit C-like [Lolium rigidum]|uniref:serine/threonine-protein phosphatase 6 regulatory ankyrin repeat subunit C-like n=1 Tax=Lolium rigidum TaxID=89674 RepID=UPI001F5C7A79|nr:serine/threonine-protein phosphatase 6 regulatory ankyrin repeat subunit C-like [Lolium rigidum]
MRAAMDGNLGLLKGTLLSFSSSPMPAYFSQFGFSRSQTVLDGIVKSLPKGNGDLSAIFSFNTDGANVLHIAAYNAHLKVCKYLVEELGGDVNAPAYGALALGSTPFMMSAQSGDFPTFEYFLHRGGDLMKADDKGRTVLHHAAGSGSCKITEFLLSKGVPVDLDCGRGTPLYMAATNEQDKTLKILLDHHANPNIIISGIGAPLLSAIIYRSFKCVKLLIMAGADVNGKGSMVTPLVFATMQGGYTNFIQLLLMAGADPNIPDDMGRLPIEYAASRGCVVEVAMLLPVTTPIPNAPDWSIEGVFSFAKIEDKKPIEQRHIERRNALFKSQADMAFRQKEYKMASQFHDLAIDIGESAMLYANSSLCKLLMGDGDCALSDALGCRMLRPKWAEACFRQAAAHMVLKEYKQACDALEDAQKMDPGNAEIEIELRKARELMKNPPGDGVEQ